MKVKITMEADVTDLPAYSEVKSGTENVWDAVKEIKYAAMNGLMEAMADSKDSELNNALRKAYEQQYLLTTRLMDNAKIEYT